MRLNRAISSAALLTYCCVSAAYTECPPILLTKVWNDVDGNFFIATSGYLNGYVPSTAKPAMGILLSAYMAGKPVIIRYARDSISCGNAAWNEQITAVGMQ